MNSVEPEIINIWNNESDVESLTINTSPITVEEVRVAIRKLKNNRSPGKDLITGEILKAIGETSVQKLTVILNSVWESEVVPRDWKRGIIVKIPKKGNLIDCSNWRGITLLSAPGKILSSKIYNIIME